MNDSNQSDIVKNILRKAVDEYESTSDDYTVTAKALREGIKNKNLKDVQWVLATLESDLKKESPTGGTGEN